MSLNKPLDSRQQHIADLARALLPTLERRERKDKLAQIFTNSLVFVLIACTVCLLAERLRPINDAEEQSLKAMLEYSAQKSSVPVETRMQKFLDRHQVKSLKEITVDEWNRAINCISKKLHP